MNKNKIETAITELKDIENESEDSGTVKQEDSKVEDTMNLHSFINAKKYSVGIEHRIEKHLNGDASEKTLIQWNSIYTEVMSRITN